jgi:hypothetical protein
MQRQLRLSIQDDHDGIGPMEVEVVELWDGRTDRSSRWR